MTEQQSQSAWKTYLISALLVALFVGCALFVFRHNIKRSLRWLERRYFAHLGDSGPIQWVDPGEWKPIRRGMWLRTLVLKRKKHWSRIRVKMVRFDTQLFSFRVHYGKPRSIGWIMRNTGAVAAINGGLFDKNRRPLGFFKLNGKRYHKRFHRRRIDGVFYIQPNRIGIAPGKGFRAQQVTTAFQSAPLLVQNSQRVPLTRSWLVDRRSVLCINQRGQFLMMTTDGHLNGLSYLELGHLLTSDHPKYGLRCRWALNLDGGASSQWAVRERNNKLHRIRGMESVPLFLLAYPNHPTTQPLPQLRPNP